MVFLPSLSRTWGIFKEFIFSKASSGYSFAIKVIQSIGSQFASRATFSKDRDYADERAQKDPELAKRYRAVFERLKPQQLQQTRTVPSVPELRGMILEEHPEWGVKFTDSEALLEKAEHHLQIRDASHKKYVKLQALSAPPQKPLADRFRYIYLRMNKDVRDVYEFVTFSTLTQPSGRPKIVAKVYRTLPPDQCIEKIRADILHTYPEWSSLSHEDLIQEAEKEYNPEGCRVS